MNQDILQVFSLLLSISALILVVVVFLVNFYFRIRKRFPITVNCWFCNTWSRVLYENSNSFDCPNCLQYNGFSEDGSYNKIIEAQHNVTLKSVRPATKNSNGFCESCNHNQQLKIIQLASFTPLKEENYDIEIEHFKKQLEKAYQLCRQCSKILKFTILKEKALFLGRHVFNIQKKGLNLYLNNPSTMIFTNSILVRTIKKIQGCTSLLLILSLVLRIIFCGNVLKSLPNLILPYLELFQDLYLLIFLNTFESFSYFTSYFLINEEFCTFGYFSSLGLFLQFVLFLIESSIMSIKVNKILCWSFLTLTSWDTSQEIFIYTRLFQTFCATLIFYHSFYEFDFQRQNKRSSEEVWDKTDDLDEYSDEELNISSQSAHSRYSFVNCNGSSKSSLSTSLNKSSNESPYYKTEKNIYTADNMTNTTVNTARNSESANVYSNIQNSLEDLHLGNSTFRISKPNSLPLSRSLPFTDRSKLVLSPSKLKTVTQNSWVAGGFWRNEDGSIVPIRDSVPLSRSSSQSSGFGSQTNENLNNLYNPFHSLPTSAKNSLCGDLDTFSLASEPAYHFQPLNPQPTWPPNMADCTTLGTSNRFCNKTFRSISKTFNQSSEEFILPIGSQMKKQMPFYSTHKPLGLFKLPQISTTNLRNHSTDLRNQEFAIHPSSNLLYTLNSDS